MKKSRFCHACVVLCLFSPTEKLACFKIWVTLATGREKAISSKLISRCYNNVYGRFDTKSFRYKVVSIQSRFDTSRFDTNRSRFDTHIKSVRYTSKVNSIQTEVNSIQTEVNSIQPPFTTTTTIYFHNNTWHYLFKYQSYFVEEISCLSNISWKTKVAVDLHTKGSMLLKRNKTFALISKSLNIIKEF